MTYVLHRHDARHVSDLLEPESVDLIVTSPPYFGLRSYRDACIACAGTGRMPTFDFGVEDPAGTCFVCNGTGSAHYDGQIGSEPTPGEFVDALVACTRDWLRVLKPSGSLWVNLGDKYAGSGGHNNAGLANREYDHRPGRTPGPNPAITKRVQLDAAGGATRRNAPDRYNQASDGIPAKSLMGLPWRYAIRCVDELGLILRRDVIWHKLNHLPESVRDRCATSHEYWFHFVRQSRYFAAIDEVREPQTAGHLQQQLSPQREMGRKTFDKQGLHDYLNPLGKSPGSVWSVPSEDGSLVATVLSAVADGALTPTEGERILWIASHDSSRTSTPTTPAAGNGADTATPLATDDARPSSHHETNNSPTEPPTPCSSAPSPTDSTSTTSAETRDASTPTTSRLSPNRRTTDDNASPSGSSRTVPAGTAWTTPISTDRAESAEPVPRNGYDVVTGGSVWRIPSEPLSVPESLDVDHFAAFPSEAVRRIILGWSPSGYCTVCDEPRRAVVERTGAPNVKMAAGYVRRASTVNGGDPSLQDVTATITGYACACPTPDAPTRPAVILDPFTGTGTTVAVAHLLGRHGIGTDLSNDYLRLAEWRCTNDRRLRDKVLDRTGIPNPAPPKVDGQMSLDGFG